MKLKDVLNIEGVVVEESFIEKVEKYFIFYGRNLFKHFINFYDYEKELPCIKDISEKEKLERISVYKRKLFEKPTF